MRQIKQGWNLIYYEFPDHKISPVFEFIESLDLKAQAKISRTFDLLAEYGTNLGFPHIKKLTDTPLWELRILGKDNVLILYCTYYNHAFLLLHAFTKKTQKTNSHEIYIASKRLRDYQERAK